MAWHLLVDAAQTHVANHCAEQKKWLLLQPQAVRNLDVNLVCHLLLCCSFDQQVTELIILTGFDYDADAKVEVEVHGLKGGKLDVIESFDEMGLREDLIRGIYAYGKNETRSNKVAQAFRDYNE